MKSIRIISRVSAIALVILYALYLLYYYSPWHETEGTNLPISEGIYTIMHFAMALSFFTIILKSEHKSRTKKCSTIALVGVMLLLVWDLYGWLLFSPIVRNFCQDNFDIIRWVKPGIILGAHIVLSIAVLRFVAVFPRKSLSFMGGLIFSMFSLLWVILSLNNASFHINLISAIFLTIYAISIVGMALFLYGLTLNTKQKNGEQ